MQPGLITTLYLNGKKIISLYLFKRVADYLSSIKVNKFKGGIPEHNMTKHLFNTTWRFLKEKKKEIYSIIAITNRSSYPTNLLLTDMMLK